MTCEERRDDILLLVADQLEPEPDRHLRAHLDSGCPRCAGFRAEAEAVLARVALEPDPIEPPGPALERLRARVREDLEGGPDPRSVPRALPGAPGGRDAALPRRRRWLRDAAAAALIFGLGFGASQLVLQPRLSGLRAQLAASEARLDDFERSAELRQAALSVVAAPQVKVIALEGPALFARSSGRLFWDWRSGGCYLHARGLRTLEPGQHYALWFQDDEGEPLAGGTFRVDEQGDGSHLTELPRAMDLYAPVYVTVEDTARPLRPSAEPVLSGALESL